MMLSWMPECLQLKGWIAGPREKWTIRMVCKQAAIVEGDTKQNRRI